MVSCAVEGCGKRTGRDKVSFYRVPKIITNQCWRTRDLSQRRRTTWLARINKREGDITGIGLHVCSAHFIRGCPSKLFEETSLDWAPSIALGGVDNRASAEEEESSSDGGNTEMLKTESDCCESASTLVVQCEDVNETKRKRIKIGSEANEDGSAQDAQTEVRVGKSHPEKLNVESENEREDGTMSVEQIKTGAHETRSKNPELGSERSEGESTHESHNEDGLCVTKTKDVKTEMVKTEDEVAQCGESVSESKLLLEDLPVQSSDLPLKQSECQTELTTRDIFNLERDVSNMKSEMETLRAKILDTELSEQAFQNNEGKVRFYTGFSSYALLMLAFNFVRVGLEPFSNLTYFQEFTMFMLRMRLNLPLRGLSFRFNVSEDMASRICDRWLDAMYVRLGCVINWPDRGDLKQTMPPIFKDVLGERVAVIVDCFELSIARPSTSLSQCTTWLNYKNHNTVKYLIGFTPQGVISFISEACGGKASNKYVTEHSGLLKNLFAGDIILADRGFGVAESVGMCCAKVVVPGHGQKKQLVAIDVREMFKFIPLKAHVEQEFGVVRNKYHILQTCLPVEYLTCREGEDSSVIDKIVTVCCVLTNLSKSVFPFVRMS